MPSTFSIVLSIQNSGAISTAPPMATATKAKAPSNVTLRSSFLCWSVNVIDRAPLFRRNRGDRPVGLGIVWRGPQRRFVALAPGDRQPDVGDHQHRAGEVER